MLKKIVGIVIKKLYSRFMITFSEKLLFTEQFSQVEFSPSQQSDLTLKFYVIIKVIFI